MPEPLLAAPKSVCGVILAGGQATRMGNQAKGLLPLGGSTLLEQVIKRASPQVCQLFINSNESLPAYDATGLGVIGDSLVEEQSEGPVYLGPLAGILTAMEWARDTATDCRWLASFAIDTPFFPDDLVTQLLSQTDDTDAQIICPSHGGYRHPTLSLWRIDQMDDLRHALQYEHCYKLGAWLKQRNTLEVDLGHLPEQSFFNINTPQDLAYAQTHFQELLL